MEILIFQPMKWAGKAQMYVQLPIRQWGASNVYILVLSSWKVIIAQTPIALTGL